MKRFACGSIPENHDAVGRDRGYHLAVRRNCHGASAARAIMELGAGFYIPNTYLTAVGTGQGPPVGRKRQPTWPLHGQSAQFFPPGHVPEDNMLVTSHGQQRAVRGESNSAIPMGA